ncbi:GNAT family N-acetyltransferase [Vibrio hippocampi]|uniref:N-acetyltransferase domain-containing protein n=1 Tax=Vibrio hippocampi TaxID=654686 RepID=A0ABN8DL15_9VIBR|nr:GNAT family N-acetyltransferase [Vibrio hippocampi]CAH0529423.1 hypothetical protein VHP8226_03212 [Vibrio hippocampi]
MITTENLNLKPVGEDDVDIYSQILSSNELTQYLPKGEAYTDEEIKCHVDSRIKHWQHGFGSYVIYLKSKPTIKIGYVGVEQCGDPTYSDIRYALLPKYQGFGYAFEAAKAVLAKTFEAGKHSKIYGVAIKDNIASLIVIKKLGMQLDSEANLYGDTKGLETYSITKVSFT